MAARGLEAEPRRLGDAGGVVAGLHDAEQVGGAGVGERGAPAGRATPPRGSRPGRRAAARSPRACASASVAGIGEAHVRAAPRCARCAGRRRRPCFRRDPQHRSAGDADDPHVDRAQRRGVARDRHVRERRVAAPDRGDVGGRAADLDDDAVDDAGVAQRAGDRRRRAGVERAGRRAPEAGEVGRTAVAAHHHDRARDADVGDAALDDVGGRRARSG